MTIEYNTIKEYLENIALNKGIKSFAFKDNESIVINKNSQPIREVVSNKHFWRDIFSEFKEDINKIGFLYQEKEKELPLSFGKSLAKKIGFKVNSKTQEGEIKKEQVHPDFIRTNSPGVDAISAITSKDQWERLNALSKESYGFSVSYVMMPEPICYQVHIPLENIVEAKFKSNDFLSKQYENKLKCQ